MEPCSCDKTLSFVLSPDLLELRVKTFHFTKCAWMDEMGMFIISHCVSGSMLVPSLMELS